MGGSGGGGLLVGPTPNDHDCSMVMFDTKLERVSSAPEHSQHTPLEIVREATEAGNRIVAVNEQGRVVGVVRENLGVLNKCMDGGTDFIAYVKSLSLGVYTVTVHAKS